MKDQYRVPEINRSIRTEPKNTVMDTTAMILGVISLVAGCCGALGVALGALAIILGALSRGAGRMTSLAKVGVITGAFGIFIGLIMSLVLIFMMVVSAGTVSENVYYGLWLIRGGAG